MTDGFVIRQPAGQRTLALREAYLAICDGDACEAHLLNANERWYAYKLKLRDEAKGRNKAAQLGGEAADANEALWVRMSAEEWATDLLSQYNEKTVRAKLAHLVERGFLARRSNPKWTWDRTPQWLFQRAAVQAAVDEWEATRTPPNLDPGPADDEGNDAQDESDNTSTSTRTNVRMQTDKVPNADGQMSGSIRANVRSNNTGILTQGSFSEIPSQVVYSNLEDNARARGVDLLAALPEGASSPSSTTTSERAEKHPARPSRSGIAVRPPDGGAAHAASSRRGSTVRSDFAEDTQRTGTIPAGGKIPRAAAPASIEELTPVPRTELAKRAPATPRDSTYSRLVGLFGGNKVLEGGILEQPTPSGGLPRQDWLKLNEAELELVKKAAQAEAQATEGNFFTLAIRGLDRMIGAPIKRVGAHKSEETVTLPGAYLTAAEKQERAAQYPPVEVGQEWLGRPSGKRYRISEVTSGSIWVQGVGEYPLQAFHQKFQAVQE